MMSGCGISTIQISCPETEVGTVVIDFKRIFDNAKESGMKYFFVEQDGARHPFEDVTVSYNYLEKMLKVKE